MARYRSGTPARLFAFFGEVAFAAIAQLEKATVPLVASRRRPPLTILSVAGNSNA